MTEDADKLVYATDRRVRSRYAVAREVKRGMERIEESQGATFPPHTKREILRHEVAHHIPAEDVPVDIMAEDHGGFVDVSLGHDEMSNIRRIKQLVAPLADRRFKQELSDDDTRLIKKAVRKLFGR